MSTYNTLNVYLQYISTEKVLKMPIYNFLMSTEKLSLLDSLLTISLIPTYNILNAHRIST